MGGTRPVCGGVGGQMKRRAIVAALAALVAVAAMIVTAGPAPATQTRLVANLNGANEVPGPGDPNGSGRADILLNDVTNTVCFKVTWKNITAPTAAHIHQGPAGTPGPIVVELFMQATPLPGTLLGVQGCAQNVPHQTIL